MKVMLQETHILLRSALLVALFSLMGACAADTVPIGVQTFFVTDTSDAPGFPATIWYPARGGREESFGESRIRPGYRAIQNAEIALNSKAPLIILIHGSGGSADSMSWLGLELAKLGALVVAADHPASSGGDPERASMLEVWTQPQDVTVLLDSLLNSNWKGLIDERRIASLGFSLGGASSVLLAGARLDFARFPVFCEQNDDGACRAFAHLFKGIDSDFLERANADHADARIRSAVAIAPGFSEALTGLSLRSLTTPLLIITGELDQQLPPQTHIDPVREFFSVSTEYVEISGAQHFSFLPACNNMAVEILAETNEEFVCEEFGEKSREEIQTETIDNIEVFLLGSGILKSRY